MSYSLSLTTTVLQTGDYYYIWATNDNTNITVNGTNVATINNGQVYEGFLTDPSAYIVTNNPVYVYQLTGIGGEMATTNLPSIICTGSQLVSFIRSTTETFQLNLLCKTADTGSFTLNGQTGIITAAMFQPVPGTNGIWQAARITSDNLPNIDNLFTTAAASVVANTTGLFHLGFLNGGGTTGTRLGYFSNYATVTTSPEITSASCLGNNIQLSSNLITGATYNWTGPNGFSSNIYNPVIVNPNLNNSGTYYLTANINGCGISVDSVNVIVHPLPVLNFVKSRDTICYADSTHINFTISGTSTWTVVYGNVNGTGVQTLIVNQSPFYFASGQLTSNTVYSIRSISDSNTCTASYSGTNTVNDTLIINQLPIAGFSNSLPSCEKNSFLFKDSSVADMDTLTNWYWNMGNSDIKNLNSKQPFSETYAAWGNYTIKLAVQSSMGCKSDTLIKTITVHPLPKPGFILPEVCLNDAFAQFKDTSSIPDGTNGLSYHWNFGDANANTVSNPDTSVLQNPLHKYSAQGIYTAKLKLTSVNNCIDSLSQSFTVNGAIPKAAFAMLNKGIQCSNDTVKIMNKATVDFGSITKVKIYWDFNNQPVVFDSINNPSANAVFGHLYPNFSPPNKNFRILFYAYSGLSCVDIKDTTITITASPVVQFSAIPGICHDASARQITQATETNNVSGSFTYYGNGVSLNGLINPIQTGTDTIKALYTSVNGCMDSAQQIVTIWPSPQANWAFGYPQCEKNDIVFTDSSVANFSHIIQWSWQFGDQTIRVNNSGAPFTKQYAMYGTYTASLAVTTDSGCISTAADKQIIVHSLPNVQFRIPAVVCLPGGKAQFSDSSTIVDQSQSLFTYLWKFTDNNNNERSLLKNPVHQYSAVGSYPVSLTITSKDGCIDSLTKSFSNIYPQPKAAIIATATEVCMGTGITFSDATTLFTGALQSWNWDLAEGHTAQTKNTVRRFADSGNYTISLYVYDAKGCMSDTAFINIIVDPYPVLSLPKQMDVLQGNSVPILTTYLWVDTPPAATYLWSPALYLNTDTALVPITTPVNNLTYTLSVTGKGNCTVSDSILVKVLRLPVIPNAFSPNNDGINDKWEIKYLNDYPAALVTVFDRYGQPVYNSSGTYIPWDGTFKGSPLPIGTYYYIISPGNGRKVLSGSVTLLR